MRSTGGRDRRWHLTPGGWVLLVLLLVLVILAFVAPSRGVYFALIVVVLLWAVMLGSMFPSGSARAMFRRDAGTTDWGAEQDRDYDRGRDFD
ncbi:MAG TPA: hypothetical protein VMD09_00435 [Solirubrobacteraceae bacterium]|nr:hypothetical protein [Solirubrobacteraceae bacterium]